MASESDRREVARIRSKVRSGEYGELIEGVHTWDVAAIFEDMRTLLRIAINALESVSIREQEK